MYLLTLLKIQRTNFPQLSFKSGIYKVATHNSLLVSNLSQKHVFYLQQLKAF